MDTLFCFSNFTTGFLTDNHHQSIFKMQLSSWRRFSVFRIMAGVYVSLHSLLTKARGLISAFSTLESGASGRSQTGVTKLNRKTIEEMQEAVESDPETDLNLVFFSKIYGRQRLIEIESDGLEERKVNPPPPPPEFRDKLIHAKEAKISFPLSETAEKLLATFSRDEDFQFPIEERLLLRMKRLIKESPKLWENPIRGVVVKCSDNIAVKVLRDHNDYTEYTTLQYLEREIPDIPVPRPHGLVAFSPFFAMFMTYIPTMTLKKAWPSLTHQGKVSVQSQLDGIFKRIRTLTCEDGHPLGGVCGEGVKSEHLGDFAYEYPINTAAALENLQYSVKHYGSNTYIKFLRSFLPPPAIGSVFTHGDIRQDNIMVNLEDKDTCVVTGIIDWEDAGYYPEHHECNALSQTLSITEENDWYLYLPPSIAPSNFPIRWLVNRLWGIHLNTT